MQVSRILCIIDPTTQRQRALARAAELARQGGSQIHALLCFSLPPGMAADDVAEYEAAELRRHELWLQDLVAPLREEGLNITTEQRQVSDWRDALGRAARDSDADVIIKGGSRRTALHRRFLKTSDWLVLREARGAVLLAKSDQAPKLERVLAAVNVAARDDAHQKLTDQVIGTAQDISTQFGAELHAVNAYRESGNYIHPPDLAKRVGIERNRAHVGDADPEALIEEVSRKIDASLVVIGSVARKGMRAAVVGNTAERILDTVDADILCLRNGDG